MIKREEINKKLNIFVISYAAFRKRKTGVEEYIYEILSQWKEKAVKQANITLYVKRAPLPACPLTRNDNFNVRVLKAPFAWTLVRMSLELLKVKFQCIFGVYSQRKLSVPNQRKLSVLFIPAHVVPVFCGMPAVVTIHGLEFEHYPQYYPFWHRLYLKWMTRLSCRRATSIIAVSESTKEDLIRFYHVNPEKITVIHHGANTPNDYDYDNNNDNDTTSSHSEATKSPKDLERFQQYGRDPSLAPSHSERSEESDCPAVILKARRARRNPCFNHRTLRLPPQGDTEILRRLTAPQDDIGNSSEVESPEGGFTQGRLPRSSAAYILYLGRIELKKNILNIIRAFNLFKSKVKCQRSNVSLVLAGPPGYGYKKVKREVRSVNCEEDIILTGYVTEEEKWELLKNAEVFLFPTFYEGFGMPVLEAQAVGTPVVTSDVGAAREVTRNLHEIETKLTRSSAILVDPSKPKQIADAVHKILTDRKLRENLIKAGKNNAKRFSWKRCADATLLLLKEAAGGS